MKKINKKYIIQIAIFVLFCFLTFYRLPYLVLKPGGIDDVSKQYKVENSNKLNGSVNTTYVVENQPNIPYYLYAKLRGYKISKIKDEVIEDLDFTRYIEKLMYDASISNSVYVAYKKAGKDIKISNLKQYIYINGNESSQLKVGDQLIKVNGEKLDTLDKIKEILNNIDGDYVSITYIRDNKEYTDEIKVLDIDGEKKLGIIPITIFDFETNPKITYKPDKNVFGPSGGAMMALSIYCSIIDNDLLNGKKIAGTGEIYYNGLIGPVGSVDYKIRSAAKNKVDIFFVPKDNYEEAINTKNEYNLKIEIVSVDEFNDIVNYLEENV